MTRLRFDGRIVLDLPDSPLVWTVLDRTHQSYMSTLSRQTLLDQGFTEAELQQAVNLKEGL